MSDFPITIPGTLPTDWIGWQQLLATSEDKLITVEGQTIDVYQAFEVWCNLKGIQPIYTLREVATGWVEVGAADASTSTDIILRPIYEMTKVTGGIALESLKLGGHSSLGLVKKSMVIGVILAMVGSLITPNAVPAEDRQAIEDTVTPFTIDGENVPVFIRNGNTYLQQELIDAVRATMVNRGVFDTEFIPAPDMVVSDITIESYNPVTGTRNTYGRAYKSTYNSGNDYVFKIDEFYYTSTPLLVTKFRNGNSPYQTVEPLGIYGIFSRDSNLNINGFDVFIWLPDDYVALNLSGYTDSNQFVFSQTVNDYKIQNETKTVKGVWMTSGSSMARVLYPYYNYPDTSTVSFTEWYYAYYFLGGSEGSGGVPGWNPQEQAYADLTKTFTEINTDAGDDSITVPNPNENDLWNEDIWVPASLKNTDIWTDGSTDEDIETSTDGTPDQDAENDITDLLQELIDILLRNPDTPDAPVIPEIEVGDSGDTPPAEPPLLSGSSNGLWAIYNPTLQNVHDFGAWLWSDNIIDQITRQFKNSPIDAVIGFHMIYCTPITGASKIIKAGYLDSPVSAPEVTNQYVTIDCGTVNVSEYYGNALDYMQTSISLYLPFIGIVPLAASVVMGSEVKVIYRIDVLTGTCLAQVKVIKENSDAVIYTYQGNCSVQIPLTGATYTGMVGALMGAVSTGISVMTGNLAGALSGIRGTISSASQGANIQKSGTLGSNAGALGIRIPYMIITHPVARMPYEFQNQEGIPSNNYVNLGACAGFTRVKTAHVENINNATADELIMIRDTLNEGILI